MAYLFRHKFPKLPISDILRSDSFRFEPILPVSHPAVWRAERASHVAFGFTTFEIRHCQHPIPNGRFIVTNPRRTVLCHSELITSKSDHGSSTDWGKATAPNSRSYVLSRLNWAPIHCHVTNPSTIHTNRVFGRTGLNPVDLHQSSIYA